MADLKDDKKFRAPDGSSQAPQTLPASCLVIIAILGVALVLGFGSLLRSCDGASEVELSPEATEFAYKEAAEQLVRERLREPDSAEFSSLVVYPGSDDRSTIICGYVNSRNGFGGMTGPQRFISGGTVLIEEQVTKIQMDQAWETFCK